MSRTIVTVLELGCSKIRPPRTRARIRKRKSTSTFIFPDFQVSPSVELILFWARGVDREVKLMIGNIIHGVQEGDKSRKNIFFQDKQQKRI